MLFNARAAKELKPGEHLNIDGCPGLRLEASVSRKTWTYRYKSPVTGKMKQAAIGQWPAMTPTQAGAAWEALKKARSEGFDLTKQKRERREAMRAAAAPMPQVYTVRLLIQDYIDGHLASARKAPGALAAQRSLERLLDEEPEFADGPATAVTRSMCFDLLDARKATPTATQKLRSELGSAWERALDSGRLPDNVPNWWRSVLRGKLKSKGKIIGGKHAGQARRSLRDEELTVLLAWLPNMHEVGRDATELYLWTGTRGAEFFQMRAEHITKERDGWWWTLPKPMTKNARFEHATDLRVPLIGRALTIAQHRMKKMGNAGWLFVDANGEPCTQHNFSSYIYDLQPYSAKARRRQGDGLVVPVTGWSPHHLRRTVRTQLAALGCPEEIAEAILGHMPEGIVGTYNAYTYDKERRLWLGKLAEHLEALAAHHEGLPALP